MHIVDSRYLLTCTFSILLLLCLLCTLLLYQQVSQCYLLQAFSSTSTKYAIMLCNVKFFEKMEN